MLENLESSLHTIKEVGTRMVFAGLVIGGTACTAPRGSESLKCPSNIAEVSRLVGGNPEKWREVKDVKGAWVFQSETEQRLEGTNLGRLGTPLESRVSMLYSVNTGEAWYVCPDRAVDLSTETNRE